MQGGIVAALPYLDELLAGHSLATLETLLGCELGGAAAGGDMRDVIDQLEGWWKNGQTAALATVVGTFRSAPRQPGASMLVGPDGEAVGSVSGGCVEGAVYELGEQVLGDGRPVLQRYGVSDDDAFAVGLTCGGILDVFVEKVDPAGYPQLGAVAEALRDGSPVAVATVVSGPARAAGQAAGRVAGPGRRRHRLGPARRRHPRRRPRPARLRAQRAP